MKRTQTIRKRNLLGSQLNLNSWRPVLALNLMREWYLYMLCLNSPYSKLGAVAKSKQLDQETYSLKLQLEIKIFEKILFGKITEQLDRDLILMSSPCVG